MQYRLDKYGNKISVLGYGCMRFTSTVTGVDYKKTEQEILLAYENGINYFDTAYIYPGSEACLGEILESHQLRDKVNIATKLPHYMVKNKADLDKYFNEELKRLRTDHVDYYLMHMLNDVSTWNRLINLGILDWLNDRKEKGQIRQVGFSFHGNSEMFCQLVDAYDWDMCLIQYNYLDENSQAGVKGLKHANQKGMPVFIMEPLRGGKLAGKLPQSALDLMKNYPVSKKPAAWSFDWLWNQKEVTCVLSGMNSKEMILENVKTASESSVGKLTEDDLNLLKEVVKEINKTMKVGCTGCRYCVPCPKSVDIPGIFAAYNRSAYDGKFNGLKDYIMCTTIRQNSTSASNCIKCGKCELHCPQGIDIRNKLEEAKKEFEGPIYQIAKRLIKVFMKY